MDQILVLFDIDGTLISNSNAGIQAYIAAIEHCCGVKVALGDYVTDGKTDLMIMGELMKRHGIDTDSVDMNRLIDAYLSALPSKLTQDSGFILPGVIELLIELSEDQEFIVGLATGNLEDGAREKLSVHDLYKYFTVGGYGSDAADRSKMIAAGIAKAKAQTKNPIRKIVVIGDTPMDISAGKDNEAIVIAVATGKFGMQELERLGADYTISDLKDTKSIIAILSS